MSDSNHKIGNRLLSALFVLLASACSLNYESNVESGNRDQILHVGNGDEPQEIDPHVTTGIPEFHVQHTLFEGLIAKEPVTLAVIPAVAESWEISPDLKRYTLHLRHNARWSNGDPVTAGDFVYSWKRALTPALGNLYAYMFYPIMNAQEYFEGKLDDFSRVGVQAPDDHTLVVDLKTPTPYFLQLLDHHSYFPVHPPTVEKFGAFAERGTRWTRPGNFVGNGPFILKEWKLNRILIVEKSPTYWDAATVKLNGIHFYPIPNGSTEERMFRAGQLHITERVPLEKINVYKRENPAALSISPYLGTYFYRFNTTHKPLDDPRIRMALALSINREQIVERVTKGGQLPAYSFTPPDTNGYTAKARISYDVERARALLAEAGYPEGRGFPALELIYNTDEGHRSVAIALQEMWKQALRINIRLSNNDWKVYLDRESHLDYELSRAGWIGDYLDPTNFLDLFMTNGGNNRTGWSNKRYDELLNQAGMTGDQAARYELLQEAEAILLDEVPVAPVYTYTRVRLIDPTVQGFDDNILDQHTYKHVWLEASE